MSTQIRKIILSAILVFLVATIILVNLKPNHNKSKSPSPALEATQSSVKIEEEPPAIKVYPEIEIPPSPPVSQDTQEEPTANDFIFEEDDTDFVPPPLAEEG